MLDSFKKIFNNQNVDSKSIINEELELLCGIMLEAAATDGNIDEIEIAKIEESLAKLFDENIEDIKVVLKKCLKEVEEPKSLHFFTSKINKLFDEEKKILLIENMWEIILSDGKIHDYESSLITRLSGLLYLSGVSCGNAKKRALYKISEKKNSL